MVLKEALIFGLDFKMTHGVRPDKFDWSSMLTSLHEDPLTGLSESRYRKVVYKAYDKKLCMIKLIYE